MQGVVWLKSTARQKIIQTRGKKKKKKAWLSENADSAELKYFKERWAFSTQSTKKYSKAFLLPLTKSKCFVWQQHKTSETIKCVWGWDSPARGKIIHFAGNFKIHLLVPCQNKKLFKTQGTSKSCLPTNCTGSWWSQQFISPEQLIFCCINMTSTYPRVWKHSRMPFCIQPLLGTRYHCSLSGLCVMLRIPGENWDVELSSRNLKQNSFRAVKCCTCPTKDSIEQCYHPGIYLDVLRIPLRQ